jgi:hypothetical protein
MKRKKTTEGFRSLFVIALVLILFSLQATRVAAATCGSGQSEDIVNDLCVECLAGKFQIKYEIS